ncbi:RidA family protein [Nocardia ignorata]|uniref:Enamine deaminase RidA (YjgF/YER057c/UK114 family) n=1 Tax=Nocardia ignorata TaxID=145285 RepID=A0A4R6PUP2_NOCIG|nr:RidA family protein [Nocardia ignorata]TDP42625.1 enamine deaminase RidA (YjgF/YER057c/UK114 family) [Nocardia ignorata]
MAVATYINPESLHSNPAFSQVVRVPAGADLIYVGGQNGVDATGRVVGLDLAAQVRQALVNLRACLAAAGAEPSDVVKWTLLLAEGASLQEGFAAFGAEWGHMPNPPAITAAFVSKLAVEDALIEIEAVAAVVPR